MSSSSLFVWTVLCLAVFVCVKSRVITDSYVSFIEHDDHFGFGLKSEESSRIARAEPAAPAVVALLSKPDPVVGPRSSIKGAKTCPTGYTKQGTFCFPDVDY